MTVIEEHANWTISRELGFNYSYAGLVRQTPLPRLATKVLLILVSILVIKLFCVS